MTTENLERVGEAADTCDNLIFAAKMPLPPEIHLEGILGSLRTLRDTLREVYTAEAGHDPWDEDFEG